MTSMAIALSILLEAAVLLFAAREEAQNELRALTVVRNMLMISLFAPLLMQIDGLVSNVGNIWYSAVMVGQCLILERGGKSETYKSVFRTYGVLAIVFATFAVLPLFPAVPGNEAWRQPILLITERNASTVVGSFLAFWLGQWTLITMYLRLRVIRGPTAAMLPAAIAAQAVDSLVFFPISFHAMSHAQILTIALHGWIFKVAFTVMLWPAFAVALALRGLVATPSK